jgi:hypothetical protein
MVLYNEWVEVRLGFEISLGHGRVEKVERLYFWQVIRL